jgi:hypothetical protein
VGGGGGEGGGGRILQCNPNLQLTGIRGGATPLATGATARGVRLNSLLYFSTKQHI